MFLKKNPIFLFVHHMAHYRCMLFLSYFENICFHAGCIMFLLHLSALWLLSDIYRTLSWSVPLKIFETADVDWVTLPPPKLKNIDL